MRFIGQLCVRGPVAIGLGGKDDAADVFGECALFSAAASCETSHDEMRLCGRGCSGLWFKKSSETVRDSCGRWGDGRPVVVIPFMSPDGLAPGLYCSTDRLSISAVDRTLFEFGLLDDHSDGRLSSSLVMSGSGSALDIFSYFHTIDKFLNRLGVEGASCLVLTFCSLPWVPVVPVLGCRVRNPDIAGAVLLARALPLPLGETVRELGLDFFRADSRPASFLVGCDGIDIDNLGRVNDAVDEEPFTPPRSMLRFSSCRGLPAASECRGGLLRLPAAGSVDGCEGSEGFGIFAGISRMIGSLSSEFSESDSSSCIPLSLTEASKSPMDPVSPEWLSVETGRPSLILFSLRLRFLSSLASSMASR